MRNGLWPRTSRLDTTVPADPLPDAEERAREFIENHSSRLSLNGICADKETIIAALAAALTPHSEAVEAELKQIEARLNAAAEIYSYCVQQKADIRRLLELARRDGK